MNLKKMLIGTALLGGFFIPSKAQSDSTALNPFHSRNFYRLSKGDTVYLVFGGNEYLTIDNKDSSVMILEKNHYGSIEKLMIINKKYGSSGNTLLWDKSAFENKMNEKYEKYTELFWKFKSTNKPP